MNINPQPELLEFLMARHPMELLFFAIGECLFLVLDPEVLDIGDPAAQDLLRVLDDCATQVLLDFRQLTCLLVMIEFVLSLGQQSKMGQDIIFHVLADLARVAGLLLDDPINFEDFRQVVAQNHAKAPSIVVG